jgi:hypothetical protein
MKRHAAPILAVVLLLLPVLYVGSYLALVVPGPRFIYSSVPSGYMPVETRDNYRFAHTATGLFFWPLEQIDRKVRQGAWERRPVPPV